MIKTDNEYSPLKLHPREMSRGSVIGDPGDVRSECPLPHFLPFQKSASDLLKIVHYRGAVENRQLYGGFFEQMPEAVLRQEKQGRLLGSTQLLPLALRCIRSR